MRVADVAVLRQLALVNADGSFLPLAGQVDDRFGRTIDRARVITGRRARAADELTIGESLASRYHLSVGDRIEFRSFTPEQILDATGDIAPEGPRYSFEVVGIVRRPLDLGGRGAKGGVIVPTQAFTRETLDEVGSFSGDVLRVRTRNGAADVPEVVRAARRIFGANDSFNVTGLGIEGQGARNAIDVATTALWVLAGIAALAGLVAIGLALARQMAHASAEQEALRALGLRPREHWAATAAAAVPIALGGALLTLVGASLVSPIFPVGVARQAEPDLGFHADGLVLVAGFVGVAVVVVLLGALAAVSVIRRPVRQSGRPGLVTDKMARAGAAPVVATGVAFALERGRERNGVPVRTAAIGAVLGVLGAVAALTFAASLETLATTPERYGWSFDYLVEDAAAGDVACGPYETQLADDRFVAAVAQLCSRGVEVAGHPVTAVALEPVAGHVGAPIVSGRAPRTPGEVALGAETMRAAGKSVGDVVSIASEGGLSRYRIVGQTLGITLEDPEPLADGALMTSAALARLGELSGTYLVVRLTPGVDRHAAVRHLRQTSGSFSPRGPTVPAEIERIRQIDAIPMVLAGFVTVVALIAVGYALVIGIRRRRRDLAILKTLGFDRGQVRAAVAWQATTLGALGVVVGVPLGILVGRVAWKLVADDLGVTDRITEPVLGLVVVAVAAIVLANVIAWFPARAAARTRPAVVLRSE